MRLLWVDDEKDNFFFETMLLEEEGFILDWATTIPEAAELLNKNHYNGILLDQQIKDGSQAVEPSLVVWMGTIFMCWLKKSNPHLNNRLEDILLRFRKELPEPNETNTTTPIMIVSGFYDNDVQDTINKISEGSRYKIKRTNKPLEEQELLNFALNLKKVGVKK
ncbi:response regulator [Pseudoalteromonas rubra]|uniref:response regulator n=1 Tax=Pseudoalteromonas rubra TaxID=43658 RepID=UPI000F7A23DA|nr:response regulator [Pseudoalteromonas rubra]